MKTIMMVTLICLFFGTHFLACISFIIQFCRLIAPFPCRREMACEMHHKGLATKEWGRLDGCIQ